MLPDLFIPLNCSNCVFAVLLALTVLVFKRGMLSWTLFAFGMVLLAVESALAAALLDSASLGEMLVWQKYKDMVATLTVPTWLVFSLCYSRANYRESLNRWKWPILLLIIVPMLAAFVFPDHLLLAAGSPGNFRKSVSLGASGKLVHLFTLLGSILVLMNLERTFRSASGVMRWRIKYLVFGAGLLFGARVYTSSQTLLYSSVHSISVEIDCLAFCLGGALMTYSFFRTRFTEAEIYPSQKVLQQSITVVLAGAYLVLLGGMAHVVTRLGGDPSFPVKALVVMVAVVCFSVFVLSARVQQKIKFFVSRNFSRPAHDHRKVWAACTERTALVLDPVDLSRAVAQLISETFEILSVTIWLADENRKNISFGASTSLTAEQAAALRETLKEPEALLEKIRAFSGPIQIETGSDDFIQALRVLDPDHFAQGGTRMCVPLVSGREIVGFITLASRVSGRSFSAEDFDLLTCIANHVAGTFRSLEMSRTLIQNKEMQAFQTMSAFFVHDLRNSASTLSLMLKNLVTHFGNPEFQEDCLQSLSKSVAHINDLINRLTAIRHDLDLKKAETNLNGLISSTLTSLAGLNGLTVVEDFRLASQVAADPEQMRKVITNLLLNAGEAVNGHGQVRISTAQRDSWAVLTVADNGCGMTSDFLKRSLFRPFHTTKKSGMGIGMFHSKTIVEAHRGRIEVESELGKGTTFRVLLPLQA